VKTNASYVSDQVTTAAKSSSQTAYTYAASTGSSVYGIVNKGVTETTPAMIESTKQTYNEKGVSGIAQDTASGAKRMSYSAWNMLSSVSSSLAQKVSEKMDEAVEATLGEEYH